MSFKGLDKVYFCAGARNHALLKEFHCEKEFILDERMASFMALGEAKKGRRVGICTTSGTATLECLPALCEAFYSGLDYVLITADRPKTLQGTNAPQTINQIESFKPFVHHQLDLESVKGIGLSPGVTHINIALGNSTHDGQDYDLSFFNQKKVLFLISHGLYNYADIYELISTKTNSYYFEVLTGLHHTNQINNERDLLRMYQAGEFEGIIRIGHTPLSKLWREIDLNPIPTYHVDPRGFKGLSYGKLEKNLSLFLNELSLMEFKNTNLNNKREDIIAQYPHSQYAFIKRISENLAENSHLYLGNSSLIRDFEVAYHKPAHFYGNRGANGIDGQLATAIGIAKNLKEDLYVMLGDLTFEYDINALKYLPENIKLIIFNNGGGRIFERIGIHDEIILSHEDNYQDIVKAYGLTYSQVKDENISIDTAITELKVSAEETLLCFKEL